MQSELFDSPLAIPAMVVGATKTVHPRKGAADEVAKMFAAPERADFADVHRPLPQERGEADAISAAIVRFVWKEVSAELCEGAGEGTAAVPVS